MPAAHRMTPAAIAQREAESRMVRRACLAIGSQAAFARHLDSLPVATRKIAAGTVSKYLDGSTSIPQWVLDAARDVLDSTCEGAFPRAVTLGNHGANDQI